MNETKMTLKEEAVAAAHKKHCLADDAAMNAVFQNNPRLVKAVLVPILGRSDFTVVKVQTQKHVEGFDGHSVRFDCLVRFEDGTLCDLEMQKSGGGMNAERIQAYQDALGSLALGKGEDYARRKRTVLVVINDGDLLKEGLPLYEIRPMVLQRASRSMTKASSTSRTCGIRTPRRSSAGLWRIWSARSPTKCELPLSGRGWR